MKPQTATLRKALGRAREAIEMADIALGGTIPTTEPATPAQIRSALALYGSIDVMIDDNAKASRTNAGTWVAAWVWVAE